MVATAASSEPLKPIQMVNHRRRMGISRLLFKETHTNNLNRGPFLTNGSLGRARGVHIFWTIFPRAVFVHALNSPQGTNT